MSSEGYSKQHSAEEKEHDQRMLSRVQWHMHERAQGRYRKGGRGCSQEPENGPRKAGGRFGLLSYIYHTCLSIWLMRRVRVSVRCTPRNFVWDERPTVQPTAVELAHLR